LLSNLFGVGVRDDDTGVESLVPDRLARALLAKEGLWGQLPAIRHYAHRPTYNQDFVLCGPGWHAESGILVHGPDIMPDAAVPGHATGAPARERLPFHLRSLLQVFCWSSDADLTNAVGVILTAFLGNHFVDAPKPVILLDGNQPGLGKTLLVSAIGLLLDGAEPRRLALVRDEELEKRLGAILRASVSTLLLFDNVRARIDSPLIEANCLSPVLSFRLLGASANIERPNSYLWVVTSNATSGTEDIISRALAIRLRYEGNPQDRTFQGDPAGYATNHRLEILGELAGLVERWKLAERPLGTAKHRCVRLAQVIGGSLTVAGLGLE
jgi:hypothetical protein